MVQFAAVLLRGVIATFVGLLIAGGTLTLAADRAPVPRPTLVPVVPTGPTSLRVPEVAGQAYVFAKGILQDHGLAWHVTGPVQGFAANTVSSQRPTAGTTVLDTGAPTVTLTLARNASYLERGTPENDAPYAGTAIRLPANVEPRPQTTVAPRLEPVPVPVAPRPKVVLPPTPSRPAKVATAARLPDFVVPGAPREPAKSQSLPDRVATLAAWIEKHREASAASMNHLLYEHAYVVAGARFGWWHGADALQALIGVDKRAEALWGVGSQSRRTAEKAFAEVRTRT